MHSERVPAELILLLIGFRCANWFIASLYTTQRSTGTLA